MISTRLALAAMAMIVGASACAAAPTPTMAKTAARSALRSILIGDSKTFLAMIDRSGLAVGMDNPAIPKAILVRDFQRRNGTYCIAFRCKRPAGIGALVSSLDLERPIAFPIDSSHIGVKYYRKGSDRQGFGDLIVDFVARGSKLYITDIEYT